MASSSSWSEESAPFFMARPSQPSTLTWFTHAARKPLALLKATSRSHPNRSHLASPGRQLLMTTHGPLDLRGSVGTGRGYDELLPHSTDLELTADLTVRLPPLETLIELKEETAHEKDLAVLPLLRRTLEERSKS